MKRPALAHPGFADTDALLAFHRAAFGNAEMRSQDPAQPPATGAPATGAPATGAPATGEPPAATTPPAGYLPQEQVAAIATRERAAGERAAQEALAQSLGVPVEEAKRIIEAHRAAEEAAKTETQRALDAANAEKAAAEAAKTAAAAATHQANLVTALVVAGVNAKDKDGKPDLSKVERVALLVEAPIGAKPEEIQAAIENCKTEFPAMFESATPTEEIDPKTGKPKEPPKAPGSDPAGTPPRSGGNGNDDAFARGRERAKQRGNHGRPYPQPAGTT